MLTRFFLASCLALVAAAASAAPQPSPLQRQLARALAERPAALVVGDQCQVRGAVWANGPRAGVHVALIDVVTAKVYQATTDANGFWSVSIPYSKPAVYQERVVDAIRVPKAAAASARIHEGGAVCDHRLTSPTVARKEAK